MSEAQINNPHDQLFKEAFSHVENAAVFFQTYLPAELHARLDLKTLKLQPGHFTDEALWHSESDLLYTVQSDDCTTLLYCLFEHQSTPDAWMPLRLLRYILGIWEQYRKQNPTAKRLPPVLPLVLFQGGSAWTADLSVSGLIDIPTGFEPYQPQFQHLLVDLSQMDADELKGTLLVKTCLLALKYSRQGMHKELPRLFQLLAEMTQQHGSLSMIRTLLRYICTVDNETDLKEYMKQVAAINAPKFEEEFMTIAEQLISKGRQEGRQEGRQQGMQQGMQQGEAKTLVKILEKRFGSVPASIMHQIQTADTGKLDAWIDAALDASSLQDIFS